MKYRAGFRYQLAENEYYQSDIMPIPVLADTDWLALDGDGLLTIYFALRMFGGGAALSLILVSFAITFFIVGINIARTLADHPHAIHPHLINTNTSENCR